jgi:acyl-CoA synthetase (AMP-forming)/AMP-acid ligase II
VLTARGFFELVAQRARATPQALLGVDETGRELSFSAYHDAALRCAAALAERGVGVGTPVSWQLPTSFEALILAAALSRLGAVQNPVLPIYRQRELGFVLRQSGARLLVVPKSLRGFDHGEMGRKLAAEIPELDALVLDDGLPEANSAGLPEAPELPDGDALPTRWIFYTSGTTADPKGARHTDATPLATGRALCTALELRADDRVALVFPITHIGGIGWLSAALLAGCAHIVIPTFDPEHTPSVLARHGVTQATAGTVFHQAYLAAQRAHGRKPIFPGVRAFPGGGAPKPPQLHHDIKQELGGAGIVSGYGLTECPIATMGSVDDSDEKLALTEGRPTDGVELCVSASGEILVRGPQLCLGYLDASLDAAAFDDAGFFRTGDLGHLDEDGHLIVTGRTKDVIIRKGENIPVKEVEDLLFEHPKVADVAVIGLPDPQSGERGCAVVVCAAGEPLTFEEMVAYLRERELMVQKIPEQLELLDELPRNPSGKVLKQDLRERFS